MKNLSDNTLGNSIYKMPYSKIKMSVEPARCSLVIGATLLAGLLPFSANAQVSEVKSEVLSDVQMSQEKLELLSEQDKVAQQQLSKENEENAKQFILTPEPSIDKATSKQRKDIRLAILLNPQALTTYSANPQVGSNRCTDSFFDNYGCYALQLQGGQPFSSSVSSLAPPSASALNAQEANTLYFPNGNPPGTWLETEYPFPNSFTPKSSFNVFAIGAAKAMHDWKTPVFFEIDLGSGLTDNAVLESITFNSPFNNVLSSLCGSLGFNNKGANVSTVASDCAFASGINSQNPGTTVSSIDIAYWPQSGNGSINRIDRTYTGSSLNSFILNNFNMARSRTYVWDPPQAVETVPERSPTLGLLTFSLLSVGSFIRRKRK